MGLAPLSTSKVQVTRVALPSGASVIKDFAVPMSPQSRSLATDRSAVEAVMSCVPEPTLSFPFQPSFAPTPSRGPSVVWLILGSKSCQGDHLGNSTNELTRG